MRQRIIVFQLLLTLALSAPAMLRAQAVGAITGTVTDPSGAVIPSVKVTATRVQTGISQSTVTVSAGTYTIPSLVVGTYNVTAEAGGFKTGIAAAITLDVAQRREVDFKLALAGVTARVEVNAAPPLLNTTDGAIAGLVSEEQVQNLPLNGRSIANLVMLQPGMAQDSGYMGWFAPQWISNGNRGETTVATLDGTDATDREFGTIQFWDFNLDAIAEFKVAQNSYSAQYGHGAGTITQMVSKTGTNQFHGSAFEFVRNSDLDARNFFATSVPPLQRNEFGGTFGGPIKKDKTFFFGEYGGYRQLSGEPNIFPVPTAAERQGQVTITDPVIPNFQDQLQVPLNSVAQQVLNTYPMPNQPNGLFGAQTYNLELKTPLDDNQFSVRLDQNFSNKDSFFARASYINHRAVGGGPIFLENPSFVGSSVSDPRNYSVSETHIFSPTLLSTFTFTLNRQIEGAIPSTVPYSQTSTTDGSLTWWGPDTTIEQFVGTYFEPTDSVTWTKGRHTFSLGGTYERGRQNEIQTVGPGVEGGYQFAPGTALLQAIPSINGGSSLAVGDPSPSGLISMMEGDDMSFSRSTTVPGFGPAGGGATWVGLRRWHLATWIQDDIKVTSKLTVNVGLRYEYNSVPYEPNNRIGGVADYGNLYGDFVLNPRPLYPEDYLNFGPRLGIADRLSSKTVLRGGFGIFSNMIPTCYADQDFTGFPDATFSTALNVPYLMSPPPVSLPALTDLSGNVMPPQGGTKAIPPNTPVNVAPIANVVGTISGYFPSDRLRNGYTINGNATVEHEFPGSVDLSVSYVANNGVHLYDETWPNAFPGAEPQYTPYAQITPGLGSFAMFYNGAYSSYNGLQVQARKISPSHGLQFQANYTWSKDMTDADDVWSAPWESGATLQNLPSCLKCEYAPASYNVSQRFVANFEYNVPLAGRGILPKRLAEGWKLLGIFSAQSGFPFTVVGPYGALQYGFSGATRPFNLKQATRSPILKAPTGPQYFSDAVIADAATITSGATGTFFGVPQTYSSYQGGTAQTVPGNLGRNTFTSPRWSNLDFSVVKDTRITESKTLQLRAEFFNVLNQSTFGTPNMDIGNPTFGLFTGTATTERQIQFGLRFIF